MADLTFTEFYPPNIPKYAIASHRWKAGSEPTLKNVRNRENTQGFGFQKVQRFRNYVRLHIPEVKWLWIDTCCINQKNPTELSEAINSMFKWYRQAEVCLAYLEDVSATDDMHAFEKSVWFLRGWTLQELLAPETVIFLSENWQVIGHKGRSGRSRSGLCIDTGMGLHDRIAAITRIPEDVLDNYTKSSLLSIEEKLRWMDNRETTREEDSSHCLLGILGVSMTIRYGDGKEETRERLLRKARRRNNTVTHAQRKDANSTSISQLHADNSRNAKLEELEIQKTLHSVRCIEEPLHHMSNLVLTSVQAECFAQLNAAIAGLSSQLTLLQEHNQKMQHVPDSNKFAICAASQGDAGGIQYQESYVASTAVTKRPSIQSKRRHTITRSSTRLRETTWRMVIGWRVISRRVLDLAITHATSGWDAHLRVYNQVSDDSEIVRYCCDGDLAQVRRLVAQGKASLLDRSSFGSLLHVSRALIQVLI